MDRIVRHTLFGVILYWLGMWVSIAIIILLFGDLKDITLKPIATILIGFLLISLFILPIIYFVWFFAFKTFSSNKYLVVFLYNLICWIIITILLELQFKVLSGERYGIDSFRKAWYSLLALSTLWSGIAFYYIRTKINVK